MAKSSITCRLGVATSLRNSPLKRRPNCLRRAEPGPTGLIDILRRSWGCRYLGWTPPAGP